MFRTDAPGNVDGKYVEEDDTTLQPPTQLTADALNAFQEELANVVEASGLVLDKADNTQVAQAIARMIASAATGIVLNGAVFEASVTDGKAVRWDGANARFDEAIADGTANNRAIGIADVANGRLYVFGRCPLFAGTLTAGQRYYLSSTVAGALVTTAPSDGVAIGIAEDADTMILDIDGMGVRLDQDNVWAKRQRGAYAPDLVSVAASVAIDLALANRFYLPLTENTVLATPTNIAPGEYYIEIKQHAAAAKTLGFSSFWKFANGVIPSVSTTLGAVQTFFIKVDKDGTTATCVLMDARS